jgi:hypothetical protein
VFQTTAVAVLVGAGLVAVLGAMAVHRSNRAAAPIT